MTINHTTGPGAAGAMAASTPADREPGRSAGLAWQREMERAQMSSWFQPPLVNTDQADAPSPPTPAAVWRVGAEAAPATGTSLNSLQAHSYAPTQAPYGMSPDAVAPDVALRPAQRTLPAADLMKRLSAVVTGAVMNDLDIQTPALSAPRGTPGDGVASAQPGISVHIEPGAHGMAVWVGIPMKDAFPQARLAALLLTLTQHLKNEGAALQSLTVNGCSIWSFATSTPPRDTPQES